ncbi:unnamed protein product [Trichogramma brassicae]|uniref:Reverse transcriptase domain-containing protein n=1 Tax=Trichogramma brassicae TaxID=86971 RepID=A0A6H5J4E6_9HYME|nr:unnamed protein product [Trichogramma brassicae]
MAGNCAIGVGHECHVYYHARNTCTTGALSSASFACESVIPHVLSTDGDDDDDTNLSRETNVRDARYARSRTHDRRDHVIVAVHVTTRSCAGCRKAPATRRRCYHPCFCLYWLYKVQSTALLLNITIFCLKYSKNQKQFKTGIMGFKKKFKLIKEPVGSDSQVPVVDGCEGGQYPASSESYPGAILKTADVAELSSQKPPGDVPPRRSSIGGYSDVSSASLSKRKRTSSGAAGAVDPCEIFLSIEADISMILDAFAARSRKEKYKEAMDAVPGRLENIRQDVFKFAMENALLKARIAQLEGQLEAAQSRSKSFAEVAQRKVVHKERLKTVTTAQAAGQPPKPKPTRARKRSPKRERFVATVRATSALGVRTGEELKAELFKAVDPVKANIGFDAIVKAKDLVIVEVRSRADLNRLLGSNGIKEKLRTLSRKTRCSGLWRVKRSRNASDELVVSAVVEGIDVLLIAEPHTHGGQACALGNFSRVVITGQRGDETPWAAVVVLSPNITATHLRQYSSAHCVCVELSGAFGSVVVISQYHQYSHEPEVNIDYLDRLLSRLRSRRVIIGMDLNGTSPQWSSRVQVADERGLLLEEVIHRHGLAAVYRPGHPSTSVRGDKDVDVTLVTSELEAQVCDWTVRECWTTDDHRPITYCLREQVATGVPRTPRYNVRRAYWKRYGREVSRLLEEVSCTDPATPREIDALPQSLSGVLLTAAQTAIPRKKMTSEKIAPKSAVNSLMVDDSSTTGWTETATALLDGFFADPATPDRVVPSSKAADTALWSVLEVLKAVRSMKSEKCPGEVMIEADMIKAACGYYFLRPLTCLMNACLRLRRFSSSWKSGAICVLLKSPDKDRSALKSYRPVCLLPVLSKVLERFIRWRLLPVISSEDHASSRQFGFRAGHSTADAIGLARSIVSGCGKPLAFGILFDITGAFDNLRWHSVMEKLATRSCPGNIWQLVRDYLDGRTVSLTSAGSRVARKVKKGATLGSILGPDMWNMCMDPVLREVQERGGEIVAYADDLLLLVPGDRRTDCEVRAQSMTDVIAGWARRLSLEISRSKTEMILLKNNATGAHRDYRRKGVWFLPAPSSVARAQWGISYGAMRHLYAGVFLPTMLYAVMAWGDLVTSTLALKLERMQRVALLRICRAYRTASIVSLQVCAGLLPLDFESIRWRLRAQIKRGASFEMYGIAFQEGDNKRQALQRVESSLLALWQERWTTTSKGEVAKRFFPTIESRISKDFVELDHYVSQFLTGHGDFSYRLNAFKLAESPLCSCGADETVRHVLLECGRLEAPRVELKEYMARVGIPWPPDLSAFVETKEVYGIFRGTCRALLLEKRRLDVEERDRARTRNRWLISRSLTSKDRESELTFQRIRCGVLPRQFFRAFRGFGGPVRIIRRCTLCDEQTTLANTLKNEWVVYFQYRQVEEITFENNQNGIHVPDACDLPHVEYTLNRSEYSTIKRAFRYFYRELQAIRLNNSAPSRERGGRCFMCAELQRVRGRPVPGESLQSEQEANAAVAGDRRSAELARLALHQVVYYTTFDAIAYLAELPLPAAPKMLRIMVVCLHRCTPSKFSSGVGLRN